MKKWSTLRQKGGYPPLESLLLLLLIIVVEVEIVFIQTIWHIIKWIKSNPMEASIGLFGLMDTLIGRLTLSSSTLIPSSLDYGWKTEILPLERQIEMMMALENQNRKPTYYSQKTTDWRQTVRLIVRSSFNESSNVIGLQAQHDRSDLGEGGRRKKKQGRHSVGLFLRREVGNSK